jgi:uncharacterized integral membrane protein
MKFKVIEKSTGLTLSAFENEDPAQMLAAQLRAETGEVFIVEKPQNSGSGHSVEYYPIMNHFNKKNIKKRKNRSRTGCKIKHIDWGVVICAILIIILVLVVALIADEQTRNSQRLKYAGTQESTIIQDNTNAEAISYLNIIKAVYVK